MKNTIKVSTVPPKEGDPVQTVFIPIDQIAFVLKIPLQPMYMVNINSIIIPCLGDYDAVASKLELDGFHALSGPDGAKLVAKPEKIMFYIKLEIGLFHLMFPGKGLNVKATTEDIQKLFDEKSSIILE